MFQKNSNMLLKCKYILPTLLLSTVIAAACMAAPSDVPQNHWAKDSVDHVMSKRIMASSDGKFNGDKPVTRYELAVTLDKWTKYIEKGKAPLTPPSKSIKKSTIPAKAPKEVKEALLSLAKGNFIDSNSILLKGTGNELVTANQLSDILSKVIIRLSDRSEPPLKD